MREYDVCFDYLDFENEHARVFAENKTQARKAVKDGMGRYTKVNYVEEIKEWL